MPHILKPTKAIRQAVAQNKPLGVFMPWPKRMPFRIITWGKRYRTKEGRRTRTLVKHEARHRLCRRVRSINNALDPWWGSPREEFSVCGDVMLDPHDMPEPHPDMAEYSWWETHSIHQHHYWGQFTDLDVDQ